MARPPFGSNIKGPNPKNLNAKHAHDIAQLFAHGLSLHKQGGLAKAKEIYLRVLEMHPEHFDALHLTGVISAQSAAPEQAVDLITRAIKINPNYPSAYYNLGFALLELKRFEAALTNYDQAITLNAQYAQAYCDRAIALSELGKLKEAVESCERAIAIIPEYAQAHYNCGVALQRLNRSEEAINSFLRAIAIKPDYSKAYTNLGVALRGVKKIPEALLSYDKAIDINPGDVDAYWNKSITLLLCGDFNGGWPLYEWRWKNEQSGLTDRKFTQPLWLGNIDLAGKSILIHCEQGLGDSIQFCRYCALVKKTGARVILEVQSPLAGLMSQLTGVDELIEMGQALPSFDYHSPMLSLPLAFNTNIQSIPAPHAYLSSEAPKREYWSDRLGEKRRPRIGLVWSGSVGHANDHNRSLRLADLLAHLPQNFEYVSLQKEVREGDRDCLQNSPVRHFGDEIIDFSDTAAMCDLMDLVICVDTSVAHLAGAMGKKTWVLLPYLPDWRWMLEGELSPWYASIRLYRQTEDRTYATALQQISQDLTAITTW